MGDDSSSGQGEERRVVRRYSSRSAATLIRETDSMRIGRPAAVADISTDGLSLWVQEELQIGEHVSVQLKNEIQRFEKEVRGVVRHAIDSEGGEHCYGVELYTRLTPLDISLARAYVLPEPESGGDSPQYV